MSMVRSWPTDGSGCTTSRPCHAMRMPLRLMFSVLIAQCNQIPGEVTWQGSCISTRGLSRLLICFMFRAVLRDCTFWLGAHQYLNWLTLRILSKVIIRLPTPPLEGQHGLAPPVRVAQVPVSYRILLEFRRIFHEKLFRIFLLTTEVNSSTMRNVCGDTLHIFPFKSRGFPPHFSEK